MVLMGLGQTAQSPTPPPPPLPTRHPGSNDDLSLSPTQPHVCRPAATRPNSPLKGQSDKIFDLKFFSSFKPAWATDQQVKIFSILVKFSQSYSNFSESPRGMILCRVNLPGVSYHSESDDFSRSYLKGQSSQIFDLFFP